MDEEVKEAMDEEVKKTIRGDIEFATQMAMDGEMIALIPSDELEGEHYPFKELCHVLEEMFVLNMNLKKLQSGFSDDLHVGTHKSESSVGLFAQTSTDGALVFYLASLQ